MDGLLQLNVVLAPHHDGETVTHMDVRYTLEGVNLEAGARLAHIHLETASIPVCEFSAAGLQAQDEEGQLPLAVSEGFGTYAAARIWTVTRRTRGAVTLNYRVYPRLLPPNYHARPLFDLRTEPGGMNGAGVSCMLLLEEQPCRIHLHWDLGAMPPGARGVWSMGEGDVSLEATPELLAFSFYAAGAVQTWKTPASRAFELHYIAEPSFDLQAVAERIWLLFRCISGFFEDPHAPYKIFIRKDPFKKSGSGTALRQSFMFGYSDEMLPTPAGVQNLIAHEMVHNWPHMEEDEAGRTWYDEGTAEYYSLVLPYRAGLSTLEDVRQQIQERAKNYYANPFRHLSNAEVAERCWTDRRIQRVPYGRGFFYILSVDHAIRAASGGRRSVDDVVLALLRSERREGRKPDCARWIELVSRELGRDAAPEFEAMRRGDLIAPDEAWFGGAFRITTGRVESISQDGNRSGDLVDSYVWERNPAVADGEI